MALDGIRLGQPVKCVRVDGGWGGTMRVGLSMPQIARWNDLSPEALAAELAADMARIAAGLAAAAQPRPPEPASLTAFRTTTTAGSREGERRADEPQGLVRSQYHAEVITCACSQGQVMKRRSAVVPMARGDVFELGCGGGINHEFTIRRRSPPMPGSTRMKACSMLPRTAARDKGWAADQARAWRGHSLCRQQLRLRGVHLHPVLGR